MSWLSMSRVFRIRLLYICDVDRVAVISEWDIVEFEWVTKGVAYLPFRQIFVSQAAAVWIDGEVLHQLLHIVLPSRHRIAVALEEHHRWGRTIGIFGLPSKRNIVVLRGECLATGQVLRGQWKVAEAAEGRGEVKVPQELNIGHERSISRRFFME